MTQLAPGWVVAMEDRTQNHWVGTCGNIVMTFAYEGSHDDLRHVEMMSRCIKRIGQQSKDGARVFFVLPPSHAKPPNELVRRALVDVERRLGTQISMAAIVVGGTGFSGAIHRGVITGVLRIMRPKFRVKIESNISTALSFLLDSTCAAFQPLVRYCEALAFVPVSG